jgi:hypothetical protein
VSFAELCDKSSLGPCVNLPLHWHTLAAVTLEECPGINDGFLLQLLSRAHCLCSLSIVTCPNVTAGGFASVVCTRLCQLEIVQCGNIEPDGVMAASVNLFGCSLSAMNLSLGYCGVLNLSHLQYLTTLILDMCNDVHPAAATAVVSSCRALRQLSAAGVANFGCQEVCLELFLQTNISHRVQVLLRLHELPLVYARLTCSSDLESWVCLASFVVCARGLKSLVICHSSAAAIDCGTEDEDWQRIEWTPVMGADGAGAKECARAAARCLRARGGTMEALVWRGNQDVWRL